MFINYKYLNLYKAICIIPAAILSIILSIFKVPKYIYFIMTTILWLLVAYAIALNDNSKTIFDINKNEVFISFPSALALIVGTIFFVIYDKKYKIYYYLYVSGIILFVLGKSGLMGVDLGLINYEQYLVILSTALVVIGNLIELLNLKQKGKIGLYNFGKGMLMFGWILFVFNVVYNPPYKDVSSLVKLKHSNKNALK